MTFLIVLPTPSLHIEMVTYCTSYTNNWTSQIAYKYTGIKISYKNDKFSFEESKSKVVRGTILTLKSGPQFKNVSETLPHSNESKNDYLTQFH